MQALFVETIILAVLDQCYDPAWRAETVFHTQNVQWIMHERSSMLSYHEKAQLVVDQSRQVFGTLS